MAARSEKASRVEVEVRREPQRRGSFLGKLLKLAFGVSLAFGLVTMGAYSIKAEKEDGSPRWPWEWRADDWKSWLTFTQRTGKEIGHEVRERVSQVDWQKVWGGLVDRGEELSDRVNLLLESAEADGESASELAGGAPAAGDSATGVEPGPEDAAPDEYKRGLEAFRKGLVHFKGARDDEGARKQARGCFEEAMDHLNEAVKKRPDLVDDPLFQEVQRYLHDCIKDAKVEHF